MYEQLIFYLSNLQMLRSFKIAIVFQPVSLQAPFTFDHLGIVFDDRILS